MGTIVVGSGDGIQIVTDPDSATAAAAGGIADAAEAVEMEADEIGAEAGADAVERGVRPGTALVAIERGGMGAPAKASAQSFSDKYDVVREIGGGAEARIYLILEKATNTYFVARRSRNPKKIEDLEREVRALANVDHPNVVRVHEWFAETDPRWADTTEFIIVTEYVADANNLAELIASGTRFDEGELQQILDQALSGLRALHEKGIVHRDIKPSNILLHRGPDGLEVKIIDLGCAKFLDGQTRLSSIGVGTFEYMAPEQLTGEGKTTTASDLYSLALTIASLAFGRMRQYDVGRLEPVTDTMRELRSLVENRVLSAGFVRRLELFLSEKPDARMRALETGLEAVEMDRAEASSTALVSAAQSAGELTQFLSAAECIRARSLGNLKPGLFSLGQLATCSAASTFLIHLINLPTPLGFQIVLYVLAGAAGVIAAMHAYYSASSLNDVRRDRKGLGKPVYYLEYDGDREEMAFYTKTREG